MELMQFFVPIQALTVEFTMDVGPVQVRPAVEVLTELRGKLSPAPYLEPFEEVIDEQAAGAIASVVASDLDIAVDLVVQAVDVLRVFQHMRYGTDHLPHFGIAGDVGHGTLAYAQVGERSGHGFSHRGQFLGWTFNDPQAWEEAAVVRAVAAGIGLTDQSEGHRRALVGLQLLSQAVIEQRPALKMVELVSALEAWLLPREKGGQTYRLARAVSFFNCGRHAGDLCGRTRDTCPYLELDPRDRDNLKRLKALRDRGSTPPWLCSEWHRVVDWYDVRSDIVHGAGPIIRMKEVSNAVFWVYRYLAEPVLEWLTTHHQDPIGDLDRGLAALPAAPDWDVLFGPLPST